MYISRPKLHDSQAKPGLSQKRVATPHRPHWIPTNQQNLPNQSGTPLTSKVWKQAGEAVWGRDPWPTAWIHKIFGPLDNFRTNFKIQIQQYLDSSLKCTYHTGIRIRRWHAACRRRQGRRVWGRVACQELLHLRRRKGLAFMGRAAQLLPHTLLVPDQLARVAFQPVSMM